MRFAGGNSFKYGDARPLRAAMNLTPAPSGIPYYNEELFVEAIRTLPSRVPLRAISKYRSDDGLLIRVADLDEASKAFDHWLRHAVVSRSQSSAARVSDPLHFGWLMLLAFIGFVCFCIGALL